MYEFVIVCDVCGTTRTTSGLDALPDFSKQDVLALAHHTPTCPQKRVTGGLVLFESRQDEPDIVRYRVKQQEAS